MINGRKILTDHGSLLADRKRCQSYRKAIFKTVKKGDVVLDLGTGTGIQAFFACCAGAKKVYALETGKVIEVAKKIAAKNGLKDRIFFLNDLSTKIDLPEPVDVIVTETMGNFGLEEGILQWVLDARKRFAKQGTKLIPQTIELFVVPLQLPESYQKWIRVWKKNCHGFDYSTVRTFAANNIYNESLERTMFLGKPVSLVKINLSAIKSPNIHAEVNLVIKRNGILHGLGGWFRAGLAKGIFISNEPPNKVPSWAQVFLPLEKPISVRRRQPLGIKISFRSEGMVWRWQLESGEKKFDQSNFFGFPIPPLRPKRLSVLGGVT